MIDLRPERRGLKKVGITEENPRLLYILHQSGWFFEQSKSFGIPSNWTNLVEHGWLYLQENGRSAPLIRTISCWFKFNKNRAFDENFRGLTYFASILFHLFEYRKWTTYSDLRFSFSVLFKIQEGFRTFYETKCGCTRWTVPCKFSWNDWKLQPLSSKLLCLMMIHMIQWCLMISNGSRLVLNRFTFSYSYKENNCAWFPILNRS